MITLNEITDKTLKYKNIMKIFQSILNFALACVLVGYSCSSSKKIARQDYLDAQYEVTYNLKFIDDTIKMIPGIENMFVLKMGDDLSYEYGYQRYQFDSLFYNVLSKSYEEMKSFTEASIAEMRKSNLRENGVMRYNALNDVKLYKDYKAKKIKVLDHISIHWFTYEEPLMSQNWAIQDDTMTIAAYSCQKAICDWRGRSYEAWFTTEIPISEGPWKFYGLPGLIIHLYDTQRHYEFEFVRFRKIDEKIDVRPLSTNKMYHPFSNRTTELTKIERKKLLQMQWGKPGHLIMEADMAKVGLSAAGWIEKYHDYIELDYK